MKNIIVKIEKYNYNGEGIAFYNKKPIYIFGTIINEIVEVKVLENKNKFYIGEIVKIIEKSNKRRDLEIENQKEVGGYEIIHMNKDAQKEFKISRVIECFKQNGGVILDEVDIFQPQKEFYYRNKIVLHDGHFYKKNTREKIKINDFKLTDIPLETKLKGDVIIRKINNEIVEGYIDDKKYNYDYLKNIKLRISLGSFYQINKEVMIAAYQEIYNNIEKKENILDLYSGIGSISLFLSDKINKSYSVESSTNSINDAIWNLKNNKIKNIEIFKMDSLDFLKKTQLKFDTIIVDPTRSGLNKKICDFLLNKLKPKKIIYLSCNPSTQARDFFLLKSKYKIKLVKIFDMFPQTYHIENLLILERKLEKSTFIHDKIEQYE